MIYPKQFKPFGGCMPFIPEDCKHKNNSFIAMPEKITWIDYAICTIMCDKKCKRYKEYRADNYVEYRESLEHIQRTESLTSVNNSD